MNKVEKARRQQGEKRMQEKKFQLKEICHFKISLFTIENCISINFFQSQGTEYTYLVFSLYQYCEYETYSYTIFEELLEM